MGGYSNGACKHFPVVGYIPFEVFLLVNYFFDATNTYDRVFIKKQANFR